MLICRNLKIILCPQENSLQVISNLKVEQIHKIFKMCGSPDEPFWRKPFSANAAVFKPTHPYDSRLKDSFKSLPSCAFHLLETLLSVEPAMRGTASSALKSEVLNFNFLYPLSSKKKKQPYMHNLS